MKIILTLFTFAAISILPLHAQQKNFKNLKKIPIPINKSNGKTETVTAIKHQLNNAAKKIKTNLLKKNIIPVKKESDKSINLIDILKRRTDEPQAFSGVKNITWNNNFNTPRFFNNEINLSEKLSVIASESSMKKEALNFLIEKKSILKLDHPEKELLLKGINKDNLGMTHIKYKQQYLGLDIWGKEIVVHLDRFGNVKTFNGEFSQSPKEIKNVSEGISSASAVSIAKNNLSKIIPILALSNEMKKILEYEGPSSQKIIWHDKHNKPHLVWWVKIRSDVKNNWYYFVDAKTGEILHSYNNTNSDGPSIGSGYDLLGELHNVGTYQVGSDYYLMDAAQPMFNAENNVIPNKPTGVIATYNYLSTEDGSNSFNYFTSQNNFWEDSSSVSAHVNAVLTYNYFLNEHGRNSLDDNGMTIRSFVHYTEFGRPVDNAFWNGKFILYGDGGMVFTPTAAGIDVAGHELAHGVTTYSACLLYEGQSGALNESFSDVFGVLIDTLNWTIGEQIINPEIFVSGAARDLSDPHNGVNKGEPGWQPKTMSEFLYTTQDHGGVHGNSGIPNHAFYLTAIKTGRKNAGKIWYRALTNYLTSNSQFIDARLLTIQSAVDLFGEESFEVESVKAAWDAVEVFDGDGSNPPPPSELNGEEWVLITNTDSLDFNTLYMASPFVQSPALLKLSTTKVFNRPAVSDASGVVLFIDDEHNLRMLSADPENPGETVIDSSGIWFSVAIGPGLSSIALTSIYADTTIYYYDFIADSSTEFKITSPSFDFENTSSAAYADAMSFSYDGKTILFDSYNEIISVTGDIIGSWNINVLDISNGKIYNALPPLPDGTSAGNPSFSKTSSYRFTFDFVDTNYYKIFTADIYHNIVTAAINDNTTLGFPSYSADDRALIYRFNDFLATQKLSPDFMTPESPLQYYMENATYPVWFVIGNRVTDVKDDNNQMPQEFLLYQNYPNPFNPTTKIKFSLPLASEERGILPAERHGGEVVSLKVYDILGNEIATLINEVKPAGEYEIEFNAKNLSSGMYFYKLKAGNYSQTRKMMLLK